MNDKPFNEWVESHSRGSLNDEATVALRDVVKAVADVGKPGKLVIEVIVEPAGSSKRTVAIGGRVTRKMPVPAPELAVYYPDGAGTLHRDDPYQAKIEDAKSVAGDDAPVKKIGDKK